MPFQVAHSRQSAAAGGGQPTPAEMLAELAARGISGNLLRVLEQSYPVEQIYKAVFVDGHTAESLADLVRGASAPARPAPAAAPAAAADAEPAGAGWWDAFFVAAGWAFLIGLVWALNGIGTAVSVRAGVQATLPAAFTLSLIGVHPAIPWIVGLIGACGTYLYVTTDIRQLPGVWEVIKALGAGFLVFSVASQTLTSSLIGAILGLVVHITISKTEYLYMNHLTFTLLSWRIFPLLVAILVDMLTSLNGLLIVATWRGWTWILGPADGVQLPGSALAMWKTILETIWTRLRPGGVPVEQLPVLPVWTTRAIVLTVIVAAVALLVERFFRRVWADFKAVWSHRPFFRSASA